MWIKSTTGEYVNTEKVMKFDVGKSKIGGYNVTAEIGADHCFIANFDNKAEAQMFLDRLVASLGQRVIKADMADWNYTGHKTDHKEKRHGGS